MLLKRQNEMAQLTVKELIDMEFGLVQLQSQLEKLPLVEEWKIRVFLYQTMEYMGAYKGLATRLLEKRYGIKQEAPMPDVKGKKQKPGIFWTLDPEKKDEYEKELNAIHLQVIPVDVPRIDERILIMSGVSVDIDKIKPLIILKDAQALNN
jgi:hypothetical protein